jgi:hypothetical protein
VWIAISGDYGKKTMEVMVSAHRNFLYVFFSLMWSYGYDHTRSQQCPFLIFSNFYKKKFQVKDVGKESLQWGITDIDVISI